MSVQSSSSNVEHDIPTSAPEDVHELLRQPYHLEIQGWNDMHMANGDLQRGMSPNGASRHLSHVEGVTPPSSSLHPESPPSYLSDHAFEDLSRYTTPSFDNEMDDSIGYSLPFDDNTLLRESQDTATLATTESDSFPEQHDSIGSAGTTINLESRLLSPVLTHASTPSNRATSVRQTSGNPTTNTSVTEDGFTPDIEGLERTSTDISDRSLNTSSERNIGLASQHNGPNRSINTHNEYLTSPVDSSARPYMGHQDSGSASLTHMDSQPITRTPTIQTHHVDDDEVESLNNVVVDEESRGRRLGLSPDQRGDEIIPSLGDQEKARLLDAKNSHVEQWLDESDAGSGADSPQGPKARKQAKQRARAYSANAAKSSAEQSAETAARSSKYEFDDSGIPGPGVFVDEDESEEDEEDSSFEEYDEEPSADPQIYDHNMGSTLTGSAIEDLDSRRPWVDSPISHESVTVKGQPPSSNAAIWRFQQRVRETDEASIQATIGSRRRSEADLDSLFSAAGISVRVPTQREGEERENRDRRTSLLNRVLPRKASNNLRKRKDDDLSKSPSTPLSPSVQPGSQASTPQRVGSWARSRSPKVDTSSTSAPRGRSPNSSATLSPGIPWASPMNIFRRTRSRSDVNRTQGIGEMWRQTGGPPVPALGPQSHIEDTRSTLEARPRKQPIQTDSDDDEEEKVVGRYTMPLKIQYDNIQPTQEGFMTQIRQLNPRLPPFMVKRITEEQVKRYRRLLEYKIKHESITKSGKCPSGNLCSVLGKGPVDLPPRNASKNSDAPAVIFQVQAGAESPEDADKASDDNLTIHATFPDGIPLPPVQRLPAEFECPLCFQRKQISKPSDWTKHVHEDLQPFTCTFPNCGEPKSFKRKADWVRHENERHRQLEKWICHYTDCQHICYRKDNFVQHLVREHKLPDPNVRGAKSSTKASQVDTGEVGRLVESCRVETPKTPGDEPCRFCGNLCSTWKKLTVHLAKHMEQIGMPVLHLIGQHGGSDPLLMSPVDMDHARLSSSDAAVPDVPHPGMSDGTEEFPVLQGNHPPHYELNQQARPSYHPSVSPSHSHSAQTYPPPNFNRGDARSSYQYSDYSGGVTPQHIPDLSVLSVHQSPATMNTGPDGFSSSEDITYSTAFTDSSQPTFYNPTSYDDGNSVQNAYSTSYETMAGREQVSASTYPGTYVASNSQHVPVAHNVRIPPTSYPTSQATPFVVDQAFSTSPSEGGSFSHSRSFNTSPYGPQYVQNIVYEQDPSYFQSSPTATYSQPQQSTSEAYLQQPGTHQSQYGQQNVHHSATYPPQMPYGNHNMQQGQYGSGYYNQ